MGSSVIENVRAPEINPSKKRLEYLSSVQGPPETARTSRYSDAEGFKGGPS